MRKQISSSDNENFEPLVILQFSATTPGAIKEWVIKRITAKPDEDEGADLLARFEATTESRNNTIIIGATRNRLLQGAEELRIKKWYTNKGLEEFIVSELKHFENSENPSDILLKSEKQRIIWEELQNLRPMKHELVVPGMPTKSMSPENDTIVGILRYHDFIESVFGLHDKEDIKLLEHDWFMSKFAFLKKQDIHKIRDYFGENVAFYFAFLEYYTQSLIPPAVLGLLITLLPLSEFVKYSILAIFNVIWWTVFMERWKRRTNKLAYEWGTFELETLERPRALYYGDLQRSPITNKLERRYPPMKRMLKRYLISYPLIMASLATALTVYFTFYRIQRQVHKQYPLNDPSLPPLEVKIKRMLPSTCYSLLIIPIKLGYEKLATFLNDNENHRLQTAYENNLTSKLFIFFFVNSFVGLFNEAFFNVNYANVGQLLISLVIVNALILKFTEQIAPNIIKYFKKKKLVKAGSVDGKVSEVAQQAKTLTPFEGTYRDYLTIFEQYGYVALFSAIFPWITICALLNNTFELRADAYKYCYVYQRPFAQPVSNIGSWHYAFDILSAIAIVTNTALIAIQPSVREYFSSYSDTEYILIFVAAEHFLLAVRFAIDFAIPDVPVEVEVARAKALYESSQALRTAREHKVDAPRSVISTKL